MSGKSAILNKWHRLSYLRKWFLFPATAVRWMGGWQNFTRVVAQDNIRKVNLPYDWDERVRASNISSRSLVTADEIGRGTSTYDGITSCFMITEYFAWATPLKPKTLFANPLSRAQRNDKLRTYQNYNVEVKIKDNVLLCARLFLVVNTGYTCKIPVCRSRWLRKTNA
jgi:DNA mismatch repair ATPase MutS